MKFVFAVIFIFAGIFFISTGKINFNLSAEQQYYEDQKIKRMDYYDWKEKKIREWYSWRDQQDEINKEKKLMEAEELSSRPDPGFLIQPWDPTNINQAIFENNVTPKDQDLYIMPGAPLVIDQGVYDNYQIEEYTPVVLE